MGQVLKWKMVESSERFTFVFCFPHFPFSLFPLRCFFALFHCFFEFFLVFRTMCSEL